jgi:hypothetical protein
MDELAKQYTPNSLSLTSLFDNYLFRALMGEKELLDHKMDIFSLARLDADCLRLLRNMIYARRGMRFSSRDLSGYFGKFSWYKGNTGNVDKLLTETDKYNISLIQAFERRNEGIANTNWGNDRIGMWQDYWMVASGYTARFLIYQNNKMEYFTSQMDGMKLLNGLSGTYSIKGNVLTFIVSRIEYYTHDNDIEDDPIMGLTYSNIKSNTITLSTPLVFKFPVSAINAPKGNDKPPYQFIVIGGVEHYRVSSDPNSN